MDEETVGEIGRGLVVFAACGKDDTQDDRARMAEKIASLRIFPAEGADDGGHFERNVRDVGGSVLAVPQFTLYGDARKGTRPSFSGAAPVAEAEALFDDFVAKVRATGVPVETGKFRAMMRVEAAGDGPVTILLDSKKAF